MIKYPHCFTVVLACLCVFPWHVYSDERSTTGQTFNPDSPYGKKDSDSGLVIKISGEAYNPLNEAVSTGSISTNSLLKAFSSVDVIDEDLISTFQPNRIEEVIDYQPGLLTGNNQSGYNVDFSARGFDSGGAVFVNGHRDNQHFLVRDLIAIDHIEILKGHSSVLYGSGTPGATLNYITKRPQNIKETTLSLTAGNGDFFRTAVDSSGSLFNNHSIAFRLSAAWQTGDDTLYENVERDRWTINPSFLWRYSSMNSLRLETEYSADKQPLYFGTVFTNGAPVYDASYVDPRAKADKKYDRAGLYWNHHLADNWALNTSYNLFHTRRHDEHVGFFNKADENTLNGYYRIVNDDYEQKGIRVTLSGKLNLANKAHHVLLGYEQNKDTDDVKSKRNIAGFTLDPYNPVFDTDLSALPLTTSNFSIENQEKAWFFLDEIDLSDKFRLAVGARTSAFDATFKNPAITADLTDQKSTAYTLGFVYSPSSKSAWHVSLSDSFQPNWGRDKNNNFFEPKESRQAELGLKHQFSGWPAALQIAFYQITQDNLTTRDPSDPDFKTLSGKRRSRGAEFKLVGNLLSATQYTFGYSFIDAEITSNNEGLKGNSPGNIPKHGASLLIEHRSTAFPRLTLITGIIAVDRRYGDDKNSFTVPGYTRLDLGANYSWKNMSLRLSIKNVLDKRYIAASYADDFIYQGDRRNIQLAMDYRF